MVDNIENIYPNEWQKTRGTYSPAKKIDLGDYYLIFVSGQQAPKDEEHKIVTLDIEAQTNSVFESIDSILKACGATINNIVKAQIFLTDMSDFSKVSKIRDEWFKDCKPVSTLIEVNGMTRQGAKIEVEVTAILKK